MTYNPFDQTWIFNNFISYPFFQSQFVYPTFESFPSLKLFMQPQICQNINVIETTSSLGSQTKNNDSQDNEIIVPKQNNHDQGKKATGRKIKKKGRNVQKQLESAKKNCESNLVNQFLSYFSSVTNSSNMIIRALKKMSLGAQLNQIRQLEQMVIFFCRQISIVNSRKERKYVNKAFLQNYFEPEKLRNYMPDILQSVEKSEILTKNQFCELFRRCCFQFFRTISVASVTSSAKLNPISRPEHIKRRRIIVESLNKK